MTTTGLEPEQIDYLFPVTSAEVYPHLIIFKRTPRFKGNGKGEAYQRKDTKIMAMSRKSKLRITELVATTSVQFQSIMTLTYSVDYPENGREAKKHLNRFLTRIRQLYPAIEYVWFLEFQNRGAVHFHILTTLPPPIRYQNVYNEVAEIWPIIVSADVLYSELRTKNVKNMREQTRRVHSHKKAWEPIKDENGALKYLVKYALKDTQKTVPKLYKSVGRFWGASRGVKNKTKHHEVEFEDGDAETMVHHFRPDLLKKVGMVPKLVFK